MKGIDMKRCEFITAVTGIGTGAMVMGVAGAIVILAGAVACGAGGVKGDEAGMIAGLLPGIGLGLLGLVILHKG
jgi:hypothetical protein